MPYLDLPGNIHTDFNLLDFVFSHTETQQDVRYQYKNITEMIHQQYYHYYSKANKKEIATLLEWARGMESLQMQYHMIQNLLTEKHPIAPNDIQKELQTMTLFFMKYVEQMETVAFTKDYAIRKLLNLGIKTKNNAYVQWMLTTPDFTVDLSWNYPLHRNQIHNGYSFNEAKHSPDYIALQNPLAAAAYHSNIEIVSLLLNNKAYRAQVYSENNLPLLFEKTNFKKKHAFLVRNEGLSAINKLWWVESNLHHPDVWDESGKNDKNAWITFMGKSVLYYPITKHALLSMLYMWTLPRSPVTEEENAVLGPLFKELLENKDIVSPTAKEQDAILSLMLQNQQSITPLLLGGFVPGKKTYEVLFNEMLTLKVGFDDDQYSRNSFSDEPVFGLPKSELLAIAQLIQPGFSQFLESKSLKNRLFTINPRFTSFNTTKRRYYEKDQALIKTAFFEWVEGVLWLQQHTHNAPIADNFIHTMTTWIKENADYFEDQELAIEQLTLIAATLESKSKIPQNGPIPKKPRI